jgi:hypothetical protein
MRMSASALSSSTGTQRLRRFQAGHAGSIPVARSTPIALDAGWLISAAQSPFG